MLSTAPAAEPPIDPTLLIPTDNIHIGSDGRLSRTTYSPTGQIINQPLTEVEEKNVREVLRKRMLGRVLKAVEEYESIYGGNNSGLDSLSTTLSQLHLSSSSTTPTPNNTTTPDIDLLDHLLTLPNGALISHLHRIPALGTLLETIKIPEKPTAFVVRNMVKVARKGLPSWVRRWVPKVRDREEEVKMQMRMLRKVIEGVEGMNQPEFHPAIPSQPSFIPPPPPPPPPPPALTTPHRKIQTPITPPSESSTSPPPTFTSLHTELQHPPRLRPTSLRRTPGGTPLRRVSPTKHQVVTVEDVLFAALRKKFRGFRSVEEAEDERGVEERWG